MTEQLNSARRASKRFSCKLLAVAAMALSFNTFLPAQAEEIIWRAFNESGIKFFDEHDYEKAEQSLLNAVKEAEAEYLSLGMKDIVTKPFTIEQLRKVLEKWAY